MNRLNQWMWTGLRAACAAVAMCGVATGSGCTRSIAAGSAVDTTAGADANLDFWQAMETQRVVTNNDALHGLFLLVDDGDPAAGYEERLAAAQQRGWIKQSPPANESARMGTIAVAACEYLDERGGLTMMMFGRSPRYATRELVYLQLIPARTEHQAISGPEFLELVGRLQDESTRRSVSARAAAPAAENES